jgi:succinate-semialdehyde dehydrogenase / glutarate-semialdehyde dehydrogenase
LAQGGVLNGLPAPNCLTAATRLRTGTCFVNELVRSDPRLPFGGIEQSGNGRELSVFGIQELVNIKTVYAK